MKFLLFIYLMLVSFGVEGQIILQMEKMNSSKRIRYKIGDEIIYKLKEFPDHWYTDRIESLDFRTGYIGLSTIDLHIDQIYKIKRKNNRWFYHGLNSFLLSSSISNAYSLVFQQFSKSGVDVWHIVSIVAPVIIWYINYRFFNYLLYNLDDKFRLRILDLNFYTVPDVIKP